MSKSKNEELSQEIFVRPVRSIIPVPHYVLSGHIETEQGQERTVRQLYEDFVLGRLDMRDLGGKVQYDPDDATEVDPMNNFGVTLEETTAIADRGAQAKRDVAEHVRKKRQEEAAKQAASQAAASTTIPPSE